MPAEIGCTIKAVILIVALRDHGFTRKKRQIQVDLLSASFVELHKDDVLRSQTEFCIYIFIFFVIEHNLALRLEERTQDTWANRDIKPICF